MFRDQAWLTLGVWAFTFVALVLALVQQQWALAFVSATTLVLAVAPVVIVRWAGVVVPRSFLAAVVAFVFATLFLGEVYDFYERFWWWDVLLHGGSAVGFGLIGFAFVFMSSDAAAAISSAKPEIETISGRPSRSGSPRRSSSAGQPRRTNCDAGRTAAPGPAESCH